MALTDGQKTELDSLNETDFRSTFLHSPNEGRRMGPHFTMGSGPFGDITEWETKDPKGATWTEVLVRGATTVLLVLALIGLLFGIARSQTKVAESTTPNVGLTKPEHFTGTWGEKISDDLDIIDQEFGKRPETIDCDLETTTLLYDNDTDTWICGTDAGSGTPMRLDFGDDDATPNNESEDLGEIAITGDTTGVFSEPTPDKLLIDASQPWAGSGAPTALDLGDDGNDSANITEIATSGDTEGIFTEPSADKLAIDVSKIVSTTGTQTITNKTLTTPNVTAYAVASLPTCGASQKGQIARLTDGDVAGSYVQCDGVSAWRSSWELSMGVINLAFPPYNCDKDAADNTTCLQAMADEIEKNVTASPTIYKKVFFPHRYATTSGGITFDFGANTSAIIEMYSTSRSGGFLCNYTGTTPCVKFTGSGSSLNTFVIHQMQFQGGASKPDTLVKFDKGAQIYWWANYIGNFNKYGVDLTGSTVVHGFMNSSLCEQTGAAPSASDARCIIAGPVAQFGIHDWSVEIATSTAPTGLCFAEFVSANGKNVQVMRNRASGNANLSCMLSMNTSAYNMVQVIANEATGLLDYGLKISGFSTSMTNLIASENNFQRSTLGGTGCILIERVTGGRVDENQCDKWTNGIEYGRAVLAVNGDGNQINNGTNGFLAGVSSGTVTGSSITNTVLYNVTGTGMTWGGTSGGNNHIGDTVFEGTHPSTYFSLASMNASLGDSLKLANKMQVATCADGAGTSSVTITVYYGRIFLNNLDADGCNVSMSESGMFAGISIKMWVGASAGGTVSLADDPNVTELVGAASWAPTAVGVDMIGLTYMGAHWGEFPGRTTF